MFLIRQISIGWKLRITFPEMTNPTVSSPLPIFWHCPCYCTLTWTTPTPRIFSSSWFPHKKPSSHWSLSSFPGGYVFLHEFRVPLRVLPGNCRRLGGWSCWFDVSSEPIEPEERNSGWLKTRFRSIYQGDQQFSRIQQTGDRSLIPRLIL